MGHRVTAHRRKSGWNSGGDAKADPEGLVGVEPGKEWGVQGERDLWMGLSPSPKNESFD